MYYFVSDIHLGGGTPSEARATERRFIEWLDSVADSAEAIFICGDLFDFWFEYKRVVPKGFVRTLGRFAALTDRGVRVVFMVGNHDQWVRDYFEVECGMEIYTTPHIFSLAGRKVYVAHGDNIRVDGSPMLNLMNRGFRSSWLRAMFSALVHPNLALKFGQWWSHSSKCKHVKDNHKGKNQYIDLLLGHASSRQRVEPVDYYIFGHVHDTLNQEIDAGGRVVITNDWSNTPYCAVIDAQGDITLQKI